jgi:tetratricopeptide (TPR) repeat protein
VATGDALKNLGRYSEAAEEYEKEIRINPNDAYGHKCTIPVDGFLV